MVKLHKRPICVASAFLVPWLTFLSPSWLSVSGVGPSWAVLWLLPWALIDGPCSAVFAALFLGLVLDGMGLGGSTQIPALMALGFWWGRLGRRGPRIEGIFNLGLLAWVGTVIVGLSLWIQIVLIQSEGILYKDWGLSTLLAQTIITALVAPIICSWLLLYWRASAFKEKG